MKKDKIKFKTYLVNRCEYYKDFYWDAVSAGELITSDMEYRLNLNESWVVETDDDFDTYIYDEFEEQ
jgi:hypothetical protein